MPVLVSMSVTFPLYNPLLPAVVPIALPELCSYAVDLLHCSWVADAIVIWRDANNPAMLLVQLDVVLLEMTFGYSVSIP